ncbi:hypothetical protein SNE40_007037 [Patella caerulea]|uniref:Uncharacterized protein n=1 Tax=Patella caerulea TaxID=87958 RepID=A0AAN8JT34_PATCE
MIYPHSNNDRYELLGLEMVQVIFETHPLLKQKWRPSDRMTKRFSTGIGPLSSDVKDETDVYKLTAQLQNINSVVMQAITAQLYNINSVLVLE